MAKFIRKPEVDPESNHIVDPGAVRCPSCHKKHELEFGDSECRCGQWFNGFGQALRTIVCEGEDY